MAHIDPPKQKHVTKHARQAIIDDAYAAVRHAETNNNPGYTHLKLLRAQALAQIAIAHALDELTGVLNHE